MPIGMSGVRVLAALVLTSITGSAAANPDGTRPPTPADAYYFTPPSSAEASLFFDDNGDASLVALELAYARRFGAWRPGLRLPLLFGRATDVMGRTSTTGIGNFEVSVHKLLDGPYSASRFLGAGLAIGGGLTFPTASDVLSEGRERPVTLHPDAIRLYQPGSMAAHIEAGARADVLAWSGFFVEARGGLDLIEGESVIGRLGIAAGFKPVRSYVGVLYDVTMLHAFAGDTPFARAFIWVHRPAIQLLLGRWSFAVRYMGVGDANHHGASCDLRVRW